MKNHGLWQRIRAQRIAQERGFKSTLFVLYPTLGKMTAPYRPSDAISKCAYRYMRLYRIRKCVGAWNDLCRRIAIRMGEDGAARCLTLYALPNISIHHLDEPHRAIFRFYPWDVERRLKSLADRKAERQREQDKQKAKAYQSTWKANEFRKEIDRTIRAIQKQIKNQS